MKLLDDYSRLNKLQSIHGIQQTKSAIRSNPLQVALSKEILKRLPSIYAYKFKLNVQLSQVRVLQRMAKMTDEELQKYCLKSFN